MLAEQVHAAAERLEPRAALRVDKVAFCRRINGYGRYDPWPEGQPFQPNDLTELYVEIRHLTSEAATGAAAGEGFVTRLTSTLEVSGTAPAGWWTRPTRPTGGGGCRWRGSSGRTSAAARCGTTS